MPQAEIRSAIIDRLNAEQQLAVAHDDSPLLIIAGAGTGKTQTLVHRVAHLIERGTPPGKILLLTSLISSKQRKGQKPIRNCKMCSSQCSKPGRVKSI